MQDFNDEDFNDELQDIYASVDTTIAILHDAVASATFALVHADEDAGNDTFCALVQMLRRLRTDNNMCIETLVQEAMKDE